MSVSNFVLNQRINTLQYEINQITGGGSGGVPTSSNLAHVLVNGNSAGVTDLNMNFNDILNCDNLQTNTINGSAVPSGLPNTLQEVLTANNITDLTAEFRNNLSTPTTTTIITNDRLKCDNAFQIFTDIGNLNISASQDDLNLDATNGNVNMNSATTSSIYGNNNGQLIGTAIRLQGNAGDIVIETLTGDINLTSVGSINLTSAGDINTLSDIDMNNNDILQVDNIDLVTINGSAYPPVAVVPTLQEVLDANNTALVQSVNLRDAPITKQTTVNYSSPYLSAFHNLTPVVPFTSASASCRVAEQTTDQTVYIPSVGILRYHNAKLEINGDATNTPNALNSQVRLLDQNTTLNKEVTTTYRTDGITQVNTAPSSVDFAISVDNIMTLTATNGVTIPSGVAFTNAVAPTCLANPQGSTDLCNKQYVDSQSALTAYQLYFNYSIPYTVPSGATYKTLSSTQINTPTTVAWSTSSTAPVFLGGFFNLLSNINISSISAGVWTLLAFANLTNTGGQGREAFFYTIIGTAVSGAETILYTSPASLLLNTVTPLIGSVSIQGTIPLIPLTGYTGIGIKLYIQSNSATVTTGSVYFQTLNAYSSILTSVLPISAVSNLSLVLTAGNSAGSTSINMNSQNITAGGTFTATSFVGALNGTATNATNVAITDQPTTNTTYYLTFVTATSGNQPIYVDSAILTYNPSTDTLNAKNYGGVVGIYQKTTYLTTQINTITSGSIITDGMVYMSNYSSASPSTINDIITINLPTPTASLEGFTLTFRKLRGSIDNSTTNWTFVAPSPLILSTTRSLTTTGGANAISNQTGLTIKYIIAGYLGVYYYLQI